MVIDEAMRQLSHDERVAVVFVHFNGLTESEAAEAAGWCIARFKFAEKRGGVFSNSEGA